MSEAESCERDLTKRAVRLLVCRQHADGLALAELAIRTTPDDAAAWYALGEARRRLCLFDSAQVAFEQAQALNPDSPWSAYFIGLLHYQRADYARAYQIVGNVLKKYPKHIASYELLADIMLRQGHAAGASQVLRIGLRVMFQLWIGEVRRALGEQRWCALRTRHNLWLHHALGAARRLGKTRNRRARLAEAADRRRLEATGQWETQLWVDEEAEESSERVLTVNFFCVLAARVLRDSRYPRLLEKRALALRMIGREREARWFQEEAEDLRRRERTPE
jgi:tetratricopeptide (TPR) repeat protein